MTPYISETTITLRQTDAAGVLFYAEIYSIIHDCYEQFLTESFESIGTILKEKAIVLPIVHSEADYLLPLRTSDIVRIHLTARTTCSSSYTLDFELFCDNKCTATASTTHVCIDRSSGSPIELPGKLRFALDSI